jgi:hypothetical protein
LLASLILRTRLSSLRKITRASQGNGDVDDQVDVAALALVHGQGERVVVVSDVEAAEFPEEVWDQLDPLLRTKCSPLGVMSPPSKRRVSGASAFMGCSPVSRIKTGQRGSQLSGGELILLVDADGRAGVCLRRP